MKAIVAADATALFRPAHSPGLIPIGQIFSKLKALHREAEWEGLLAAIRMRYKNRPKFMEILDKLDPRPIVEQKRARH